MFPPPPWAGNMQQLSIHTRAPGFGQRMQGTWSFISATLYSVGLVFHVHIAISVGFVDQAQILNSSPQSHFYAASPPSRADILYFIFCFSCHLLVELDQKNVAGWPTGLALLFVCHENSIDSCQPRLWTQWQTRNSIRCILGRGQTYVFIQFGL